MRALTNGYVTIAQEITSYTKDVGTELNYGEGYTNEEDWE